jgi:hypothetical protein
MNEWSSYGASGKNYFEITLEKPVNRSEYISTLEGPVMLLTTIGYCLAAIAFYAYIYLTARPDPYEAAPPSEGELSEVRPVRVAVLTTECTPAAHC